MASVAFPVSFGSLGIGVILNNVEEIERREIASEQPMGTFSSHDFSLLLTYAKMVGDKLDWDSIFILFGLCSFLIAAFSSPQSFSILVNKMSWIALLAGISGGLGFLFFYQALEKGSASLVIPISSLYVLVAAVLAVIFLKEPLTLRKALGILFAVLAIILLSQQSEV